MKIMKYIISLLLMTNLLKLQNVATPDWYWNLFTGLVGFIYLVMLVIDRQKN
jgi:hypothetical protein